MADIEHLPWYNDAEGYYLIVEIEEGRFDLRNSNSLIYKFPNQEEFDHIFRVTEWRDGAMSGHPLWRVKFGGIFDRIISEMEDRDFPIVTSEGPTEAEMDAYVHLHTADLDDTIFYNTDVWEK